MLTEILGKRSSYEGLVAGLPAVRRCDPVVTATDDFSREVYCILGLPIDSIGMKLVLHRISMAAGCKTPFLISTPNLNFLIMSQFEANFRDSILFSDLSLPDGMPIVWIAWLMGIPIKSRVAGADILDELKHCHDSERPLKVFLFGGAEGVAAAACQTLNAEPDGLCCVGSYYPGFGSIEEMSQPEIIDKVNSSHADFVVVSLGAKKGQSWLQRNHDRLLIPVRAHLGAAVNFHARTLRRAPAGMRRFGLEWLWRIKEEPHLWKRYWNDGMMLLRLLFTRIVPLAIFTHCLRFKYRHHEQDLVVTQTHTPEMIIIGLSGFATVGCIDKLTFVFRDAIAVTKQIKIDFSNTRGVDARFLGALLMLRKRLKTKARDLILVGLSPGLTRYFRLSGLEYLLPP